MNQQSQQKWRKEHKTFHSQHCLKRFANDLSHINYVMLKKFHFTLEQHHSNTGVMLHQLRNNKQENAKIKFFFLLLHFVDARRELCLIKCIIPSCINTISEREKYFLPVHNFSSFFFHIISISIHNEKRGRGWRRKKVLSLVNENRMEEEMKFI